MRVGQTHRTYGRRGKIIGCRRRRRLLRRYWTIYPVRAKRADRRRVRLLRRRFPFALRLAASERADRGHFLINLSCVHNFGLDERSLARVAVRCSVSFPVSVRRDRAR